MERGFGDRAGEYKRCFNIRLDVVSVPCIDATVEVYCLQGAPTISSNLSTNHGNYGSWNECDIITLCVVVKSVMSQSCQ